MNFDDPNEFPTKGVCVAVTTGARADHVARALAAENIRCSVRASVHSGMELWLVEVHGEQALAAQNALGSDPNDAVWHTEAEVSHKPLKPDPDERTG